mmetsp:Transcript_15163/g.2527  ORF Transcript_15163/g.2527 Transcript_15163/m.2527 type:complete len:80 (+) Transcript_15163:442-681(+)
MANLKKIGCWGLTEPNYGSDASALETSARPVEGGFILNGEKKWIGNASISDLMIIYARNTETGKVESFIVDSTLEGISV